MWYSSTDGGLYSNTDGLWYRHHPVIKRNHLPMYEAVGTECDRPGTLQRATVYSKGARIVCTGSADFVSLDPPRFPTFRDFLASIRSLDWCTQSFEMVDDGKPLADAIANGLSATIMAVSDRSFKRTHGTAAWTVGTEDQHHMLSGSAVCPGGEEDQSAYRSELTGLYVIMTFINHLCDFYNINSGQVEIGCDGLSALQTAFDNGTILHSDTPDYDLVGAIFHLRKTSKVLWHHRHIKGHQDDYSDELDTWAQRNIQMDLKAKAHLSIATKQPRHYSIAGEPWQLWVKGVKLTKSIQSTTYAAVQGEYSEQYWRGKKDIDATGIKLVDWTAIGNAMKLIPRPRRVFVAKHVSGMCGVGRFMKRWKEWPSDACPRCGDPEDSSHVWTCKGPGTTELWDKAITDLSLSC
jgi:hypothetical protein